MAASGETKAPFAAPPPSWLDGGDNKGGHNVSFLTSSPFATALSASANGGGLFSARPSGLLPGLGSALPVQTPLAAVKQQQQQAEPESAEDLHCATCDKDFLHSKQLVAHLQTHVTCEVCNTFSASRKVVNAHIDAKHPEAKSANRLAGVLSRPLETPEEIEAWRAERRKRWPSAAVIQEKEEDLQRRIERGEVIPSLAKGRGKRRNNGGTADEPPKKRSKTLGDGDGSALQGGLAALAAYGSSDSEREESSDGTSSSSGQSGQATPSKAVEGGSRGQRLPQNRRTPCRYYRRGFCRQGARCTFEHSRGGDGRRSGTASPGKEGAAADSRSKKPTLLQRLLADELQRERTTLLAAIRYICAHNFLDATV